MKLMIMAVAFLLVSALAVLGGSAIPATAQGSGTLTAPDNPTVENGNHLGEVIVRWNEVPEAKFYKIN